MAILVELRTGEVDVLRLSLEGQALEHYWEPYVISFSAPAYQTAQKYGGFVRMDFGQVTLSPDAFLDGAEWPPPKSCTIDVYYTVSNEAAKITVFSGNVYLEYYDEGSITYNLYDPTYTQELLQTTDDISDGGVTAYLTGVDYEENDVALPRAFGIITHAQPVRLPDDESGLPTYHLGGLGTGSSGFKVESFSKATTKTKVVCTSAHGWSNGQVITLTGSVNFNGAHTIESASGDEFIIDVAFPTDSSESLPIHASVFVTGSFSVFDDGVPIQEHVVVNGDDTFSLTYGPAQTVTISGTGADTTLTDVMDWATTQLGIGTYDDSGDRATSPDVSYWADSQMPLIDFVSDLCAFFTHYFYIKSDTLYLCDMLLDNGTATLDEYEYFQASYSAEDAVKQIKSEWITHVAVEERLLDEITSEVYVKDVENESVVTGSYPWGQETDITPYHDTLANVTAALNNILTIMNKETASINIPIAATLPNPGKKLTFSDNIMPATMSTYIWARTLQFDFENDEVQISGEGVAA